MKPFARVLVFAICIALPCAAVAEKPKVAVLEFTAKAGAGKGLADLLADLVANAVRSLGKYDVIGKSDIKSMLGLEEKKRLLGCDDTSCLAEIGGALGADLLVAGNFGNVGNAYLVNLRLINPKKALVKAGVSRKVSGGEEALVDDVPGIVAELFGEEFDRPAATTASRSVGSSKEQGGQKGELVAVEKALEDSYVAEYTSYEQSREKRGGMSFAEYVTKKSRKRKIIGIALTFGPPPVLIGVSTGIKFGAFESGETPGIAILAVSTILSAGSLVTGIVLWAQGSKRIGTLEPLIPRASASSEASIQFIGLAPLLYSEQELKGVSLGFRF